MKKTKKEIIDECWNRGTETNIEMLSKYELLIKTFAYNCIVEFEKHKSKKTK